MKLDSKIEKKDQRVIQRFVIRPSSHGAAGGVTTRGGGTSDENVIFSKFQKPEDQKIAGRHGN